MRKKYLLTIALVLLTALVITTIALAQEGEGGGAETFDSASLEGWELSPEAAVVDGVLQVSPGQFALRFGDYSDITLNLKLQYTSPSEVLVHYYFRDMDNYALIFLPDNILLMRREQGGETALAETQSAPTSGWMDIQISVSGGQHTVTIDGTQVISATDPNPLQAGAVMLMAHGENGAAFDDFSLSGTMVEGLPPPEGAPEGEPMPEGEHPPEGEPVPEGGQPGAVVPLDAGGTQPQGLIEEFFAGQSSTLTLTTFAINLVLSVVFAYILSLVYIYWGTSLTNRRRFASNFMLMTVTTTFIILVVRSSVALSLGLVGALSIVRFRAAIKEPEELAYLFFAIAIGIGLGDNQRLITFLALASAVIILGLMKLFRNTKADANLHLTVTSHAPNKVGLEQLSQVLEKHCSKVKLLRYDEHAETLETSFLVEFRKVSNLNQANADLQALSEQMEISFLDNQGIW